MRDVWCCITGIHLRKRLKVGWIGRSTSLWHKRTRICDWWKNIGWIDICTWRYTNSSFVPSQLSYTSGLWSWQMTKRGGGLTIQLSGHQSWCKASEDKITCIVDHWLEHIIEGFLIEFMVDTSINYSKAERHFLKGTWGKYLRSLNTYIKMLLCEKWLMLLPWCLGLCEVGELIDAKEGEALNIAFWLNLLWVTTRKQYILLCKVPFS